MAKQRTYKPRVLPIADQIAVARAAVRQNEAAVRDAEAALAASREGRQFEIGGGGMTVERAEASLAQRKAWLDHAEQIVRDLEAQSVAV